VQKKRILLVSAMRDSDISNWVNSQMCNPGSRTAFTTPLSLGTIAALTPDRYEVVIWDEAVRGPITEETGPEGDFDLVGITAYSTQLPRARNIARIFRARGILVVAGGAGVTVEPAVCRDHFDVLFIGEAEETWPNFLADWESRSYARQYSPSHLPDMRESPKPRWGSSASTLAASYKYGAVQVNRGCPHECEFCAMWSQFGRKVRSKRASQVVEEVAALAALGFRNILFCTDNFYGSPRDARELVQQLLAYNRSSDPPLRFFTELSIRVSQDDEILRNMADTGFTGVLVGVESSSVESLRETRKRQNLRGDLAEQCRKIASYGIVVQASMIVGFDNDRADVFDQHFRFLQDACIPLPRLHVLTALPGTDLRRRLVSEGRVVETDTALTLPPGISDYGFSSNILFKHMRRSELYAGLIRMLDLIWAWENFETRIVRFIDNIKRVPQRKPNPSSDRVCALMRKSLLRIPGADLAAIGRILEYADKAAPELMIEIVSSLVMMCWENGKAPALKQAIRGRIEIERNMEERNGYVLCTMPGDSIVPFAAPGAVGLP
jgi:radical SAM superfamily enzyme YgiQ (UPF0313 family)